MEMRGKITGVFPDGRGLGITVDDTATGYRWQLMVTEKTIVWAPWLVKPKHHNSKEDLRVGQDVQVMYRQSQGLPNDPGYELGDWIATSIRILEG